MLFKRLNNKYIKTLNDLPTSAQPTNIPGNTPYKISKIDQIDLIAVNSYGAGSEGLFKLIAYKNADQLLAWDLDNEYIDVLLIPNKA
jgi:hypothetical protein